MILTRFLRHEHGVVTIDWTVIAAALVALGLATGAVVRDGLEALARSVSDQFGGPVLLRGSETLIAFEDFEAGASGWSGGAQESSDPRYGGILGRFGGTGGQEGISRSFSLDPARALAVIEFDLHAIDTWDLEEWRVFGDGALLASRSFSTDPQQAARQAELHSTTPGITTLFAELPGSGFERGYLSGDPAAFDQAFRVRIIVENPGDSFTLGFGATLDEGIANESWAIDNLRVLSTDAPRS